MSENEQPKVSITRLIWGTVNILGVMVGIFFLYTTASDVATLATSRHVASAVQVTQLYTVAIYDALVFISLLLCALLLIVTVNFMSE